jgi:hypothetical protein
MSTVYVVVTILAAAWVGFSAVSVLVRAKWVVQPLADYGVPRSWWPWLGMAKLAGAAGLLVGLFVPVIAVMPRSAWCSTSPGPSSPCYGRAGTRTYRIHWCTWHRWSLPSC